MELWISNDTSTAAASKADGENTGSAHANPKTNAEKPKWVKLLENVKLPTAAESSASKVGPTLTILCMNKIEAIWTESKAIGKVPIQEMLLGKSEGSRETRSGVSNIVSRHAGPNDDVANPGPDRLCGDNVEFERAESNASRTVSK